MKQKHNEGFSLVEVLVAILILGIFVVPTCSSMVMAVRMNNKTDEMLKAQLAVSSAIEELKAEGIEGGKSYNTDDVTVTITAVSGKPYYNVTVKCDSVEVTTQIRAAVAEPTESSTPSGEEGTE